MPTSKSIMRHTWEKGAQYLKKMGGIIMIASIIIWFLGYYPRHDTHESVAEQQENSYIGQIDVYKRQENGTALSDYTLFEGAERAVIINADSKELPVLRILGANSMYDIVKFNTEADKKTIALKSASQPASVGETVYLPVSYTHLSEW